MINKLITHFLLINSLFISAYACDNSTEYRYEFKKTENILDINIRKQDGNYFYFYDISTPAYPMYIGMKIHNKQILYDFKNELSYPNYFNNNKFYNDLFTINNNRQLIDINNYLNVHNSMIKNSNITGEQKISFHVLFLEDLNSKKCSYFESPIYNYNIDMVKYLN